MSRLEVFFITFITYVSIHSIRSSYSFSKPYLIRELQTDTSYFGFLDAGMMLTLGIGYLYNALNPPKDNIRAVWMSLFIASILFGMIPLVISEIKGISKILIVLLILMQGWTQSYQWPNLLLIVQSKYSYKSDSKMLSFWSSSCNFGNMFGFLACHLISLVASWYFGIIFVATFVFVMGIIFSFRIQNKQKEQYGVVQNIEEYNQDYNVQPSLNILWKNPTITCIMAIFSLLKSIIYSLLFWMPLYFYEKGLSQHFWLVPIVYQIACVIGSLLLGLIFTRYPFKGKVFAPVILLLVFCFICLRLIEMNLFGYFSIIGLVGGLLGGLFNLMSVLITLSLSDSIPCQFRPKYVGFYSDIIMAAGNLVTALTQIIIGFISKQDHSAIFMICGIYAGLALFFSFFLIHIQQKNLKKLIATQKL